MTGTIATIVVLGVSACSAVAANRIEEWGGHDPRDYFIDQVGGEDRGVRILANTEPDLPWKFEAYDSVTDAPGHIDYIRIEPGPAVRDIKLSVIGQPPVHQYGAQDLDLLDLVDYGAATNVLQVIDIAGDCGADGEIRAYGAQSITIGGNLGPYGIHILGAVTGDIRVEGAGPHTGSLHIEPPEGTPHDGDIYFGGSASGGIELNGTLGGMITVAGDAEYSWNLSVDDILEEGGVDIAGDLHGRVQHAAEMSKLWGLVHVGGDFGPAGWLIFPIVSGTGRIEIDGNADGTLNLGAVESLGSIQIGAGLAGTLDMEVLRGAVTVSDDVSGWLHCSGDLSGAVELGSLSGWLRVAYALDAEYRMTGSLTVNGDVSGEIDVGRLDGDIYIAGDLSGPIDIGTEQGGDLDGSIQVAGAMAGTIDVAGDIGGLLTVGGDMGGSVHATGNLNGDVLIDGALEDSEADYEIEIDESKAADAVLAVNYDGPNPDDDYWYGVVKTGEAIYSEPAQEENLWEVTCYKGDMNNDADVNAFDIDPFVLALTDRPGYLAAYPGLAGSVDYRGDMNCDEAFDSFDIDAFTLRLTDPEAYYALYNCEVCPGESLTGDGGEIGSDPADVAELFELYVAPERLPFVIDVIGELVAYFGDTPPGQFWSAVLTELQ